MRLKKRCFLWALLFVFLAASTVFAKDYALRKVCWGMTKAQVKAAEKDELIKETKDTLIYSTYIKGYPFQLEYCFNEPENLLGIALLKLKTKPTDKIFFTMVDMLKLKYGKPTSDKNITNGRQITWYIDPTNIAIIHDKKEKSIMIYYLDFTNMPTAEEVDKEEADDKL